MTNRHGARRRKENKKNLCKEIDGVRYIYSEVVGKMIPKYVWAFDSDDCKFEWNETDAVYYNNAENFMMYDTAIECGFLTEAEYINAKIRKDGIA